MPREHLDLRFCPYHQSVLIRDQKELFRKGITELDALLNDHKSLKIRREAFLNGDYLHGAGCSPQCYWYQTWREGGRSYRSDDYLGNDGRYRVRRIWLSLGPDCNLTCRYCLEPKHFHINYKTCSPAAINLARDLVLRGSNVLLTGGEPFLPKFGLLETFRELANSGQRESQGRFDIQTNGIYLNHDVRRLLLQAPISGIGISMDTLRPDIFEYLRRGASFEKVWDNARSLVRERNAAGLQEPSVTILCAVMRANCDHLAETIDRVVAEGMDISLNVLFKAYFSPDFSRDQSVSNLSLKEMYRLAASLDRISKQYGDDGPVKSQAFRGQLAHIIEQKRRGDVTQVILGTREINTPGKTLREGNMGAAAREWKAALARKFRMSGEAMRKGSVIELIKGGHLLAAAEKAIRLARRILL
ncbi:radical SAM protein [uncultured Thiodictyon sp.]|uniref:radical SAM protein n=1 Tax=uncultured Thiodictyon sp. TaxID=1846217 RepID=UPI0025FDEFB8|nr:radical SAM protein [uncultured Thiodictyon sp.]